MSAESAAATDIDITGKKKGRKAGVTNGKEADMKGEEASTKGEKDDVEDEKADFKGEKGDVEDEDEDANSDSTLLEDGVGVKIALVKGKAKVVSVGHQSKPKSNSQRKTKTGVAEADEGKLLDYLVVKDGYGADEGKKGTGKVKGKKGKEKGKTLTNASPAEVELYSRFGGRDISDILAAAAAAAKQETKKAKSTSPLSSRSSSPGSDSTISINPPRIPASPAHDSAPYAGPLSNSAFLEHMRRLQASRRTSVRGSHARDPNKHKAEGGGSAQKQQQKYQKQTQQQKQQQQTQKQAQRSPHEAQKPTRAASDSGPYYRHYRNKAKTAGSSKSFNFFEPTSTKPVNKSQALEQEVSTLRSRVEVLEKQAAATSAPQPREQTQSQYFRYGMGLVEKPARQQEDKEGECLRPKKTAYADLNRQLRGRHEDQEKVDDRQDSVTDFARKVAHASYSYEGYAAGVMARQRRQGWAKKWSLGSSLDNIPEEMEEKVEKGDGCDREGWETESMICYVDGETEEKREWGTLG